MGWNLEADDLISAGVTKGAPLGSWNQHMLRFAKLAPSGDWAGIDPNLLAEEIREVLEIVQAVASAGGTPVVVGNESQVESLWTYSGIPVIDPSVARRGMLADMPPSEQRLARLLQWSSQMNIDVSTYINAADADLRRERRSASRSNSSEFVEQPDILVAINIPVPILLLAASQAKGIPFIATVEPNTDPRPYLRVLPGDFGGNQIRNDLMDALAHNVAEGRRKFNRSLVEYGDVGFLSPNDIRAAHGPAHEGWLQERIQTPQASIESDEVIASWGKS